MAIWILVIAAAVVTAVALSRKRRRKQRDVFENYEAPYPPSPTRDPNGPPATKPASPAPAPPVAAPPPVGASGGWGGMTGPTSAGGPPPAPRPAASPAPSALPPPQQQQQQQQQQQPGLPQDGGQWQQSEPPWGPRAAAPAAAAPSAAPVAGPPPNPDHSEVTIFFGTDRLADPAAGKAVYGPERGAGLQYGLASVTIPATHRRGAIERPSIFRLEFREDPSKHIVLDAVLPVDEEMFVDRFRLMLAGRHTPQAFVFVHGFNVSFEDACLRTAQLGYDLKDFVPALFSWPSRGSVVDYTADATAIQWCRPHLRAFIETLVARTGVTSLHLIAHSMGSQALAALVSEFTDSDVVKEVILAAADLDRRIFEEQIAPALVAKRSGRTTVYASSADQALQLSKRVNAGYPRLGDCEDGVCVVPGVETIDVSGVAGSRFGLRHSTVFDVRTMVDDLHRLLDNGMPAERRGLDEKTVAAGKYWIVPAG